MRAALAHPIPGLVFAFSLGLVSPQASAAPSAIEELSFCLTPTLAHLSESTPCRARFVLSNGDSLCIPQTLWNQWLRDHNPPTLCGVWRGRWRATSPLLNNPIREATTRKTIAHRFMVKELPQSDQTALRVWRAIERTRNWISTLIAPQDSLGVSRHLLLSERAGGDSAGLLRMLGFVHLLTATGIHLYALATLWNTVFRFFLPLLGIRLSMALWITRISVGTTWLAAWILSGARQGMLRPLIIVSIRSLARYCGFRWARWAPLFVALSADLAVACFYALHHHPNSWAPGRWIYALAVGGGMLTVGTKKHQHLMLAIGSWVFVAIFEGWHLHLAAAATPLLSFVTLPLFCLIFYPAFICAILLKTLTFETVSELIATKIAAVSTIVTQYLCHGVTAIPTLWTLPQWTLLGGAIGASFIAIRGSSLTIKTRVTIIAICLLMRLVLAGLPTDRRATISVEQLDVGQGDAALVITSGDSRASKSVGLIDVGAERTLTSSAWIELLAARGIHSIDWIALTHLDEDHVGGLRRLAQLIPIGCVVTSEGELKTERGRRIADRLRLKIRDWSTLCVPFPVLQPPPDQMKNNGNMGAVLVPFQNGGFYLSAGDADIHDEIRIGRWAKEMIDSYPREIGETTQRILKIGHHGSRTSSTPKFLDLISPTEAWISAGVGNRYKHPHTEVLELLNRKNIPIRRTDHEGSLKAADDRHPPQKHRQ